MMHGAGVNHYYNNYHNQMPYVPAPGTYYGYYRKNIKRNNIPNRNGPPMSLQHQLPMPPWIANFNNNVNHHQWRPNNGGGHHYYQPQHQQQQQQRLQHPQPQPYHHQNPPMGVVGGGGMIRQHQQNVQVVNVPEARAFFHLSTTERRKLLGRLNLNSLMEYIDHLEQYRVANRDAIRAYNRQYYRSIETDDLLVEQRGGSFYHPTQYLNGKVAQLIQTIDEKIEQCQLKRVMQSGTVEAALGITQPDFGTADLPSSPDDNVTTTTTTSNVATSAEITITAKDTGATVAVVNNDDDHKDDKDKDKNSNDGNGVDDDTEDEYEYYSQDYDDDDDEFGYSDDDGSCLETDEDEDEEGDEEDEEDEENGINTDDETDININIGGGISCGKPSSMSSDRVTTTTTTNAPVDTSSSLSTVFPPLSSTVTTVRKPFKLDGFDYEHWKNLLHPSSGEKSGKREAANSNTNTNTASAGIVPDSTTTPAAAETAPEIPDIPQNLVEHLVMVNLNKLSNDKSVSSSVGNTTGSTTTSMTEVPLASQKLVPKATSTAAAAVAVNTTGITGSRWETMPNVVGPIASSYTITTSTTNSSTKYSSNSNLSSISSSSTAIPSKSYSNSNLSSISSSSSTSITTTSSAATIVSNDDCLHSLLPNVTKVTQNETEANAKLYLGGSLLPLPKVFDRLSQVEKNAILCRLPDDVRGQYLNMCWEGRLYDHLNKAPAHLREQMLKTLTNERAAGGGGGPCGPCGTSTDKLN